MVSTASGEEYKAMIYYEGAGDIAIMVLSKAPERKSVLEGGVVGAN